jgi:L-Ala-D/L-Glu epimerase
MRIERAQLHFLEIPFRLSLSHGARSGRVSSDSIVLHLGSSTHEGYGEAVIREYVSGSLGQGDDMRQEAARITAALIGPLRERNFSWDEAVRHFAGLSCDPSALPLLCAAESAVLACAVDEAGTDAYAVLGRAPVREAVVYGVVLPFVPLVEARKLIGMCAQAKISNVKVKVGRDLEYNEGILSLCRQILGPGFDLRVDANSAWTASDTEAQLEICARHDIRLIEQPFPASESAAAAARLAGRGFAVMADEGVLTSSDVRGLAASGAAQVLNLRLSKNGGLTRVLTLAAEAEACGLSYQLGCMVGETGVLSCMGRLAASLVPRPRYVEGSYDELLLEDNIVSPSFGFGPGGQAPIMRGAGMGYRVQREKLDRFTLECLAV